MQKLETRNTYTPMDAPQVRSNCDSVIKHGHCDQVLQNLKTVSNNSDVDQQSGKTGQDLRVFVLNMRGKLSIRKQHYNLQPNDIVRYNNKEHYCKGVHCRGSSVMLDIKKSISIKKVKLICYGKGVFAPIPPTSKEVGLLGAIS